MSFVKSLSTSDEYTSLLTNTPPDQLVVVDFTAQWCGPCQMIKPVFAEFSLKYRHVVFATLDVDKVPEAAKAAGVTSMPTFQFFKAGSKLTELKGANKNALETLIKQYGGSGSSSGTESAGLVDKDAPAGYHDLTDLIEWPQVDCLNQKTGTSVKDILKSKSGKARLESDVDEQLVIAVPFIQMVRLHSIKIVGPKTNGPKTIKTYINRATTISFDEADSVQEVETLTFTPEEVEQGKVLPLRFVKYQSVNSVNIFVVDNHDDEETTSLHQLVFYGVPLETTKMSDFKKVPGTE